MAPNLDWPVKVKSESGIFKRVVTWFPFHRQKGWVNNRSVGNQKIITQTLHKSVQKIITTPKSVSNSWQAKITWVIRPVATRLLRFTCPVPQTLVVSSQHLWLGLRPQEGSESGDHYGPTLGRTGLQLWRCRCLQSYVYNHTSFIVC